MIDKLKKINHWLLEESPQYLEQAALFPDTLEGQFDLYRALVNVRAPKEVDETILALQDTMLQEYIEDQGIVQADLLEKVPADPRLSLWKGDITQLAVDGIVNAANEQMLGCFIPGHGCIDNIIHTKSGMQLRLRCQQIMEKQGQAEPVGKAKITPAFNLPSRFILHTVGPQVHGSVTVKEIEELKSCYREVLELAEKNHLTSLAFCCISTGVFHFPADLAATIAIKTVQNYLDHHPDSSLKHIIFNVFTENDLKLYQNLLYTEPETEKEYP